MIHRHIVSLSDRRRRGERGAVLIHVAVALVGLLAFSMLVIDYGVMWAARNQAQNAADAAALAAAVSLAYYDPDDIPRARAAAIAAGQANLVWGQAPDIQEADVIIPYDCPPGAPGLPDTCVRVNVYRNQDRNPLPVYFAPLVGITEQGVQAMAVAQVLAANASDCVKPFAIPDKWLDRYPEVDPWTTEDTYDRYDTKGGNKPPYPLLDPLNPDSLDWYDPGSGFELPADWGTKVVLKWGNPHQTYSPGWYFPIDLPRADGAPEVGGARYYDNIANCNGVPIYPGMELQNEPGGMVGPTVHGIEDLVTPDLSHWDESLNNNRGGPVCDGDGCFSRRIVAIPVFDVDAFSSADRTDNQGRFNFRVVKVLGFFINNISNNGEVTGYFMSYRGVYSEEGPAPEPSSFLRTVALVR